MLSGLVMGMVYRNRVEREGVRPSIGKLYGRAAQIYRVNLFVVISVYLLSLVPRLDVAAITNFTDRFSGKVYPLYPNPDAKPAIQLARIFLLRAGPHQTQILGLYVVLLFITPALLWLLKAGKTKWLLSLSWLLYLYNWAYPAMPTGAQFEYAFPLLSWQVLFVTGIAAGYHRGRIAEWMQDARRRRVVLALAWIVTAAGFFFVQNNPNPVLPPWAHIHLIPAAAFSRFYAAYGQKNTLGLFRIANYAALLVVAYQVLGKGWKYWNRAAGWLLIPLGQASLYVFVVHVYLVAVAAAIVPFNFRNDPASMAIGMIVQAGVIAALWIMVKTRFLFRWIPR